MIMSMVAPHADRCVAPPMRRLWVAKRAGSKPNSSAHDLMVAFMSAYVSGV
jgi:hypothetical protein